MRTHLIIQFKLEPEYKADRHQKHDGLLIFNNSWELAPL